MLAYDLEFPQPPALSSERVRLRPVKPDDYPFLYDLALSPVEGYMWRFRAVQPSYEDFLQSLRRSVFVQFLITRPIGSDRLGIVVCYNADFRNKNAYVAMQSTSRLPTRSWLIDAGNLFLDYLFECYEFEKLYAECPEFTLSQFRSGLGRWFVEEARLRNHERFLGRSWDHCTLALYRHSWTEHRQIRADRATRGDEPLSSPHFLEYIVRELGLDHYEVTLDARLADDLGFDSVRMFELLVAIDDLGVVLDESVLGKISTLGDAYEAYYARIG